MSEHLTSIDRALAAWSDHDLDGYRKLYSPSAVTTGLGPEPLDIPGMRQFYEMIYAGFPDMKLERADAVSEGDKVALRFRAHGTHNGEFQGVPPTGSKVTTEGITILRFNEGKVVERWNVFDMFGLMMQIGVVPAVG